MGPIILDEEAKSDVNPIIILQYNSNFISRGVNLLREITTGFYKSWTQKKDKIDWSLYDVVYLEFSRHDFVAKYVKQEK